jgi:hypothetical protein
VVGLLILLVSSVRHGKGHLGERGGQAFPLDDRRATGVELFEPGSSCVKAVCGS